VEYLGLTGQDHFKADGGAMSRDTAFDSILDTASIA
jgi:hypothetical protein